MQSEKRALLRPADCMPSHRFNRLMSAIHGMLLVVSMTGCWSRQIPEEELKWRIGQMLMVGFQGSTLGEGSPVVAMLRDVAPGGVVLFDQNGGSGVSEGNLVSPQQTAELIRSLQRHSPIPLFVAVDQEGGTTARLRSSHGFSETPSAASLGADTSTQRTREAAGLIARQLSSLGFTMNLAPVVDVNVNPANPIIGSRGRAFSGESERVIAHARAFIDAHRALGVVTVLKHFPGHGSSLTDSHTTLPDVTDTYRDIELRPFTELIRQEAADCIMTAHVMNKKVDKDHPATLSSEFLQKLLRAELGFRGVIISDDLQMRAIMNNYFLEEALTRAILAGCDVLLIPNNTPPRDPKLPRILRDHILTAVRAGVIPSQRIIESSDRVIRLKKRYGILGA